MTLIEHIRELRSRLLKAVLGILLFTVVGIYFADRIQHFINAPYCDYKFDQTGSAKCDFNSTSILSPFMLQLKIGLYVGLVLGAPIWLYQLWAFIAPGLHRRERRFTYAFVAVATPLFLAGISLAYVVVSKSLHFFLGTTSDNVNLTIDLTGYFDFVTNMMLLFGAAFEFPLVLVMLNFAGILSGRRLLRMWRTALFLMFLFAALVTPTPDPFGMTILALAMAVLYFGAVAVAFINDARRRRNNPYREYDDDEASPLDTTVGPEAPPEPIAPADRGVWGSRDDMT